MTSTTLNTQPLVHAPYLISPEDMLVSNDPNFKGKEPCEFLKQLDQAEFQVLTKEEGRYIRFPRFPIFELGQINILLLATTSLISFGIGGDSLTVVASDVAVLGLFFFFTSCYHSLSSSQKINEMRINRLDEKLSSIRQKLAQHSSNSSHGGEIQEVDVQQLQQAEASCEHKWKQAKALQTKAERYLSYLRFW